MTSYLNEDEQLDAVKKWWSENGKSIVLGVVLGFSALFGWQGWQSYRLAQGQAGSDLYTAMQSQAASGDVESALATGKRLLGEHTGSVYAGFAALKLAQLAYAKGDKPGAVGHLEWVSANASEDVIADLARVRLARLQLDLGELDGAEAHLNAVYPGFMPGIVAELRGDIAQAKGDLEAARQAYILALASGEDLLPSVRMKLLAIGSVEKSS